jgi:hypothetical protein
MSEFRARRPACAMPAQFVTAAQKSWARALFLDRRRMAGLPPVQRMRVAIFDPGS